MESFLDALYHDVISEDGFPLPDGLFLEFQAFRGRTLEASSDLVKMSFDGGETVHAKVFDEDGQQWELISCGSRDRWVPRGTGCGHTTGHKSDCPRLAARH